MSTKKLIGNNNNNNMFRNFCLPMATRLTSLVVATFIIISHIPQNSKAQYFTGALAQATGGAGRGAAEVEETIFLNPATIAHAPSLTSGIFYHNGDTGPGASSTLWGLNIIDNNEGVVIPGALSYLARERRYQGFGNKVDEQFWQVTLGNFVPGTRVALGVNILFLSQDIQGFESYEQWNGDIGIHYNPRPDLGFGLIYYAVKDANETIPDPLKLPQRLGLGVHYIYTHFLRIRFDVSKDEEFNDDGKPVWYFGFESFPSEFVSLSFGGRRDEQRDTFIHSAGISFIGPKFSLNYSFSKNNRETNGALHSVDLKVPVW